MRKLELKQVLQHLGANIRRLRMRQNKTQAQLAEAVDVSVRHLQAVELGTVTPSLAAVVDLANELGAPLSLLFRRSTSVRRPAPGRPRKRRTRA